MVTMCVVGGLKVAVMNVEVSAGVFQQFLMRERYISAVHDSLYNNYITL